MGKIKPMIVVLAIAIMLLYMGQENVDFTYFMASILYGKEDMGTDGGNIIFSENSGFYDDEFYLSIWAPSDEIYYTLDGTEPTKESYKYEESILIKDATENQNTNSMRSDLSAYFLEEDTRYQIPDYPIDKCTVLKAAYYDNKGQRSVTQERIYFVNYEEKSGYKDVNIISITAEPEALFDEENGIYVLEECAMFRNLSENETFRRKFADKLREMRDEVFTIEQV